MVSYRVRQRAGTPLTFRLTSKAAYDAKLDVNASWVEARDNGLAS